MDKTNLFLAKSNSGRILFIMAFVFSFVLILAPSQNAEALDCSSNTVSKFESAGFDNNWSNVNNWAGAGFPTSNSLICIGNQTSPQTAELDIPLIGFNGQLEIPVNSKLTIGYNGALFSQGMINNTGNFTNLGNFQNNNAEFDNSGIVTNNGFMVISQNSQFYNRNQVINENVTGVFGTGIIQLQGSVFENFCGSSVYNTGDIFVNPFALFIGSDIVNPKGVELTGGATDDNLIGSCSPTNIPIGEPNGGGIISYGPTIGVNPMTNEFVVQRGFGIDGQEVDVKNWYTPYGWNREPGTHTFTLRILSDLGVQAITGVQLFTSEIGKWDANDPIWKVALKRPMGSNWTIEVTDKNDLIGDVTFTTLSIEDRYLLVSITISNMDPTPENYAIGVRMIDDIGGMNSNWFNDGLIIEDTFAYPSKAEFFEQKLSSPVVCTEQDDPNDRYTCAFEQKKQSELIKAQESFSIITENKVVANFESNQGSVLSLRPSDSQSDRLIQDKSQIKDEIYLNFELLQNNTVENLSKKIYLNFESLQ